MRTIEISPKTIIFTTLFLLGLYFVWIIRDLIFSLFIAFIIMSALRPIVEAVEKRKIPHTAAVLMVYVSFIVLFSFLFSLIIPPIITETTNLIRNLPGIIESLDPTANSWLQWFNVNSLTGYLPDAANKLFAFITGLFSNAIFVISSLFFGFYFLMEKNIIHRLFAKFLDEEKAHQIAHVLEQAEKRMSSWFWGELMLMTVVGVLTFIGLNLIGVKYALPLAVIAGLLEVIPNVGPILSAVPAFFLGLSQSYIIGFSSIAVYFVVQQLENNIIVPLIMKHAVGINPLTTLIALIIGGRIGGVLGILLAIPAYLFIETVVVGLMKNKTINFFGESSEKVRENEHSA